MNEELRVIEYIKEQAEYVETRKGKITASQMLERFLFPPRAQWDFDIQAVGRGKAALVFASNSDGGAQCVAA